MDGNEFLRKLAVYAKKKGLPLRFTPARGKGSHPPAPRLKRRQKLAPAPLWIAGKLAVYLAMREQGVTNSELARRRGVRETVVRRMPHPDHNARAERLQTALACLGKRIVITVADAA